MGMESILWTDPHGDERRTLSFPADHVQPRLLPENGGEGSKTGEVCRRMTSGISSNAFPAFSTMAASESEIHTTVCVIGAGLMGSSTAYAAASRINNSHDKQADAPNKSSVLVLEQYSLLHRQGSSHGESRIVRKAYPQVGSIKS